MAGLSLIDLMELQDLQTDSVLNSTTSTRAGSSMPERLDQDTYLPKKKQINRGKRQKVKTSIQKLGLNSSLSSSRNSKTSTTSSEAAMMPPASKSSSASTATFRSSGQSRIKTKRKKTVWEDFIESDSEGRSGGSGCDDDCVRNDMALDENLSNSKLRYQPSSTHDDRKYHQDAHKSQRGRRRRSAADYGRVNDSYVPHGESSYSDGMASEDDKFEKVTTNSTSRNKKRQKHTSKREKDEKKKKRRRRRKGDDDEEEEYRDEEEDEEEDRKKSSRRIKSGRSRRTFKMQSRRKKRKDIHRYKSTGISSSMSSSAHNTSSESIDSDTSDDSDNSSTGICSRPEAKRLKKQIEIDPESSGYKSIFLFPSKKRARLMAKRRREDSESRTSGGSLRKTSHIDSQSLLQDMADVVDGTSDRKEEKAANRKHTKLATRWSRHRGRKGKKTRSAYSSASGSDDLDLAGTKDLLIKTPNFKDDYLSSADDEDFWPKLELDEIPPDHEIQFPAPNAADGKFPFPPSDEESDQGVDPENLGEEAIKRKKKRTKKKQKRAREGWVYQPNPPEYGSGPTGTLVLNGRIGRYLRHYQKAGVRFLVERFQRKEGAVLGDDMGMGKTVQVICFLQAIFGKTGEGRHDRRRLRARRRWRSSEGPTAKDKKQYPEGHCAPCLIVVPSSLVYQWEREVHTWGCFHCLTICSGRSGSCEDDQNGQNKRKRRGFRASSTHSSKQRLKEGAMTRDEVLQSAKSGQCEILIMSYSMFIRYTILKENKLTDRVEKKQGGREFLYLNEIHFSCIVFDEAHRLKASKTKVVLCVKAFREVCPCKIALTGTPMQNDLKELWHFAECIVPNRFGDKKDFDEYYRKPILMSRQKKCSKEAMATGLARQKNLQKQLQTFMLRRKKEKISHQLPKKKEMVVFCNLTEMQLRTYRRIIQSPDFQLIIRANEPCDCGRKRSKRGKCCHGGGEDHHILWKSFHPNGMQCEKCPWCLCLPAMDKLNKCSNHLELLKPRLPTHAGSIRDVGFTLPEDLKYRSGVEFAKLAFGNDLDKIGGVEEDVRFERLSSTQNCGKMKTLITLLKRWKKKRRKVLLFSQSTRTLDILQCVLAGKDMKCCRLDGKTNQADRLSLCDTFNESDAWHVFLISTRAGGMGLNLTGASVVVIFDPSWNPAHDLQAMDRAYRIGQRKDVEVYRLVTKGGIEEMVYMRSYHKQTVNDTTMEGDLFRRRHFRGVAGEKNNRGNLFGMANLMSLNPEGHCKGILYGFDDSDKASIGGSSCSTKNNEDLEIVQDRVDYKKSAREFEEQIAQRKEKSSNSSGTETTKRGRNRGREKKSTGGDYNEEDILSALLGEDDSCDSDNENDKNSAMDSSAHADNKEIDQSSDSNGDFECEEELGDIVGMKELEDDEEERKDEKSARSLLDKGLITSQIQSVQKMEMQSLAVDLSSVGESRMPTNGFSSASSSTSSGTSSAVSSHSDAKGRNNPFIELQASHTDDSYSWPFVDKTEKMQNLDQRSKDCTGNPSEQTKLKYVKPAKAASVARKRSRRGVKIQKRKGLQSRNAPTNSSKPERESKSAGLQASTSKTENSDGATCHMLDVDVNAKQLENGWKSITERLPQKLLEEVVREDLAAKALASAD